MKINYQNKSKNLTLAELDNGDVFTLPNSECTYMRCDMDAGENFITSSFGAIWDVVELTGTEPFAGSSDFEDHYDCEELIVCVSLASGRIVLLYQGIEVKPLNCELVVE